MDQTKEATILVVDDNRINVEIVIGILKKQHYNIIPAYSGIEALEKIESNEIDLILLDVMMPKMNGFEVCKKIRQNVKYRDLPIIFLSAMGDLDDIIKGFQLGGNDYIPKPFRKEELILRVKNYIELKQAKDIIKKQLVELKEANRFILGVLHQYSKYVEKDRNPDPDTPHKKK